MAAAVMAGRKRDATALVEGPHVAAALLDDPRGAAALCGPISKRSRRLSPAPEAEEQLVRLREIFPYLDPQLLATTLEKLGNNLEIAIGRLKEQSEIGCFARAPITDNVVEGSLPTDGPGWVDMFLTEMTSSYNIDDARVHASRILDLLENALSANARAEAANAFQKENETLKQKAEELVHDNSVLRRGVAILHERQKDYDAKIQEMEQLKKTVSQYQERMHKLEHNNYALSVQLRHARQNNFFPGRFNPDVC